MKSTKHEFTPSNFNYAKATVPEARLDFRTRDTDGQFQKARQNSEDFQGKENLNSNA